MRLLLCLALLAAPFGSTSAQSYKALKNWIGACDNTRHCTAIGLSADATESLAQLHFERGGAADAPIERVRLRFDHRLEAGTARLVADTFVLALDAAHLVVSEVTEGPEIQINDAGEIAGLLGAIRNAQELQLWVAQQQVDAVSLAGSSAVLLWIDEQQQRLGTDSALIRRGPAKAGAIVPAAPRVVAKINAAVALDQAAMLAISVPLRAGVDADSCEETDPDTGPRDSAWQIDAEHTLIQLMCFSGAYNFGSKWYLQRPGQAPQALLLPLPALDGSGRMEPQADLINAEFSPDSGELTQFSKGRGIGDCGNQASWLWDGKRFQLQSYQLMDDCRGVASDLWPVLWRSRG